jgi:hypothetical protein
MKTSRRSEYYERADFSSLMRSRKGRKILPSMKRITINISEKIYDEAKELDGYLSMGYQNVLKAAMTLGLTELYTQVSSHRMAGK